MYNVLQASSYTFLHIPKLKYFKHVCPTNLDFVVAHIQKPKCLCKKKDKARHPITMFSNFTNGGTRKLSMRFDASQR
jgi:hypothetical protein